MTRLIVTRVIAEFGIYGIDPAPWSVPEIAVVGRGKGKPRRIVKVSKSLVSWQKYARAVAEANRPDGPIWCGPISLSLTFYRRTPAGRSDGDLWMPEVAWNPDLEKFTKRGPEHQTPDVTNLQKGIEDIFEGVFYGNDGQTCLVTTSRVYGPRAGVDVVIEAIEIEGD